VSRVVVVGGGHNGLVCACYLAQAGLDVQVLEQAEKPGGGSRTDETVAGYRFDTHSVAHNIINMTTIPAELRLAEARLRYAEMDPFAVAVFADGRRVRFHRSVRATTASIAEHDRREAAAYGAFMEEAVPLVRLAIAGLGGGRGARTLLDLGRVARGGPLRAVRSLLLSYGRLLDERLPSDLTRGPVSACAAHAGAGPDAPGGAFFAFWQAAYHLHGQWHAIGGAQALTDALVRRLEALGGEIRRHACVARIDATSGRAAAVELDTEEVLDGGAIVSAVNPKVAALELLDPPLGGPTGHVLDGCTAANSVQAIVHVAVERLPPYVDGRPGDWNGLQSYVDSLESLRSSFRAALDERVAAPAAAYAFTTSSLDTSLAPPGHHTVYLACPAAPYRVAGGWDAAAPELVEDLLDQVEARAPGFRESIRGVAVRTPATMAEELRWPGAHPMHLDITLDQLGPLRPTPELAGHRTPVPGFYLTGAGTAPTGGIAGLPGRATARAVLADLARHRRRPRLRLPIQLPA